MSCKHVFTVLSLMVFTIALSIQMGCRTQSNPWLGQQYQVPGGYTSPPQSIYAPMPSILPSIDAKDIVGGGSQDDELESVLMDLESLDF